MVSDINFIAFNFVTFASYLQINEWDLHIDVNLNQINMGFKNFILLTGNYSVHKMKQVFAK